MPNIIKNRYAGKGPDAESARAETRRRQQEEEARRRAEEDARMAEEEASRQREVSTTNNGHKEAAELLLGGFKTTSAKKAATAKTEPKQGENNNSHSGKFSEPEKKNYDPDKEQENFAADAKRYPYLKAYNNAQKIVDEYEQHIQAGDTFAYGLLDYDSALRNRDDAKSALDKYDHDQKIDSSWPMFTADEQEAGALAKSNSWRGAIDGYSALSSYEEQLASLEKQYGQLEADGASKEQLDAVVSQFDALYKQYRGLTSRYYNKPGHYTVDNIDDYMDRIVWLSQLPDEYITSSIRKEMEEAYSVLHPGFFDSLSGDTYDVAWDGNGNWTKDDIQTITNSLHTRLHPNVDAPFIGVGKGLGLYSLTGAANAAFGDEHTKTLLGIANQNAAYAEEKSPLLYGAGEVGGNLAVLGEISKGVKSLKLLKGLGPIAQGVASGAVTFSGNTAYQLLGNVALGQITPGQFAQQVLTSAGAGGTGAAAAQGMSWLLGVASMAGELGSNNLFKTVAAGLVGASFATGDADFRGLVNKLTYGSDYKPNGKEVVKNIIVSFAFGALSEAKNQMKTSTAEQASAKGRAAYDAEQEANLKRWRAEYFEEGLTPEQAKARYRELSRELHPDLNPGDGQKMADLNAAYDALYRNVDTVIEDGLAAYKASTEAKAKGDMNAAAEADAQLRESVAYLTEYASAHEGELPATFGEAVQILDTLSGGAQLEPSPSEAFAAAGLDPVSALTPANPAETSSHELNLQDIEAEALRADFEQDPVNVQRFQDGQGTYGQYTIQERLAILRQMFPTEDYYISGGSIIKARTYNTTTGQSETFGDRRTGSNHRAPKRVPAKKTNIKAPTSQQRSFNANSVKVGDTLNHKIWGDVQVQSINNGFATVVLPETGETKTVQLDGKYFNPAQAEAFAAAGLDPASALTPATPAGGLNPAAMLVPDSGTGTPLNGASEAAGAAVPAEDEITPEQPESGSEMPSGVLNSQDSESIPKRVEALKKELKNYKPGSREYEAVESKIHWMYNDLVTSAKDALGAIRQFKKNPNADNAFYDSLEDAQADYDSIISDLRELGLPSLKEIDAKAFYVGQRVEWANRKLEGMYKELEETGGDVQSLYSNPDYKYYESLVSSAGNESEALYEVYEFLTEHYSEIYPNGGKTDGESWRKSGGSQPLESDEGGHGSNPGEILENDAGGIEGDAVGESANGQLTQYQKNKAGLEAELTGNGAVLLDTNNLPRSLSWVTESLKEVKTTSPDCEVIVATHTGDVAYYKSGRGVIVIDPRRLNDWARDVTRQTGYKVTGKNAVRHEETHFLFDNSDYTATEIKKHIESDFANDRQALEALAAAYEAHATQYHPNLKDPNDLWEEVISDLRGDVPLAFTYGDGMDPSYERLKESANKYFDAYVLDSYNARKEFDNNLSKPTRADAAPGVEKPSLANKGSDQITDAGTGDPGANKSYRDSLFANEPPEKEYTGELPDDDMTPLNEQSQQRADETREQTRAQTKERFGDNAHEKLTGFSEKMDKFAEHWTELYGKQAVDEKGNKVVNDNLEPVYTSDAESLAKNVHALADGEMSVQSFSDYYNSLKPKEGENTGTDTNYFYDPRVSTWLNRFASAEQALLAAERGEEGLSVEEAQENYQKAAQMFTNVFDTRQTKLFNKFDQDVDSRVKLNQELATNAKKEGYGGLEHLKKAAAEFHNTQLRPDTVFMSLGGYDREKSPGMYRLRDRVVQGEKDWLNYFHGANKPLYDVMQNPALEKDWQKLDSGRTKIRTSVYGLDGTVSLNYGISILKTLETAGALEHIADNGAWFIDEADREKGYNNNGRGDTKSYKHRLDPNMLYEMAKERLISNPDREDSKMPTVDEIKKEELVILRELRRELRREILDTPIGRAAYEASVESMGYSADAVNPVTERTWGYRAAQQGKTYWPLKTVGRKVNQDIVTDYISSLGDPRQLHAREGSTGALLIEPFTDTINSYINSTANYVGFGELLDDLEIITKPINVGYGADASDKQSFMSAINEYVGESVGKWLEQYAKTLNGERQPRTGLDKAAAKLRSNLANSALLLNAGVGMKQRASYWNASSVLDLDVLAKARVSGLFGWRSMKSFQNDPLIQSVNKYTNTLEGRRVGADLIKVGEALLEGQKVSSKLLKFIPEQFRDFVSDHTPALIKGAIKYAKSYIGINDYRTNANLVLACGLQVQKENPEMPVGSDEFYKAVAEKFEEVMVLTQPIYNPHFRAEYLRSGSALTSGLAMFRSQPSQNYNNMVQAYGELYAAQKGGNNGAYEEAKAKTGRATSGLVISSLTLALFNSLNKLALHKKQDYTDKEGNFDVGKAAKRVGLDMFYGLASTVWFGDTLAKYSVDFITKAVTGKDSKEKQGDFFGLADNAISSVNDFLKNSLTAASDPSATNIKNAVFSLAQVNGIPLRNAYNIVNTMYMTSYDLVTKFGDVEKIGNYNDAIAMYQANAKMTDKQRASKSAHNAIGYFGDGNAERAYKLLGSLDMENSDVITTVKAAFGDAYVRGEIDEKTYKDVMQNYVMLDDKAIDKNTSYWQRKFDAENGGEEAPANAKSPEMIADALAGDITAAKNKAPSGTSKSAVAAQTIIDASRSDSDTDKYIRENTSAAYKKSYDKLRGKYTPSEVVTFLAGVDTSQNDELTQKELYAYYLENQDDEEIVEYMWNSMGYHGTNTKDWKTYKAYKAG